MRDARLDQAFAERMSIVQQQIRSMVAVPLQTEDRVIGLIYLDSPHFIHEFTSEDLNLLTVMANIAAIRIEHARLAEVEQAERVLAKELAQAAEIQQRLLPPQRPGSAGAGTGGLQRALPDGGRRLLRLHPLPGRARGDAGGRRGRKGHARRAADVEPAGARAGSLRRPHRPGALVTRLNRIILPTAPTNRFITFLRRRCWIRIAARYLRERRSQSALAGAS